MTRMLRGVAGLLLALLVTEAGRSAAPPMAGPLRLTAEQQKQVLALKGSIARAEAKGQFEDAERSARQIAALREQWQGPRHWETIDARLEVEAWRRRTKIPAKDRAALVAALRLTRECGPLIKSRRFPEAEAKLREALDGCREALGDEHLETATNYRNVGFSLKEQKKYADALAVYEKALGIEIKALGAEHPELARSYNNMATAETGRARYQAAQLLHEKALAIRRRSLGEDHPDTAFTYHNLAACLDKQGRALKAMPFQEAALRIRRQTLGEEDVQTAASYNGMAALHHKARDHARALPLFEEALRILRKRVPNPERSPEVANLYGNVGACLDPLGQHGRALPFLQKALEIRRGLFGEEDRLTAASYSNVGACLEAQGQYGPALQVYENALKARVAQLGEDHDETMRSYAQVAACLNAQGQHGKARPLFERVLKWTREKVGEKDPKTAECCTNLASCLQADGQHAKALSLLEQARDIYRETFGSDHPTTARSTNRVASWLDAQGQHAKAQPLHEAVLANLRKRRGEAHLETAASYASLALCLDKQGKHADARPLFEKALAIRRAGQGELHPATAQAHHDLAVCLEGLKRLPEATRLLQASVRGQEVARFHYASSGFERARAAGDRGSPHASLALDLARLGQPRNAFRHAEAALARGLLDDLARTMPEEARALEDLSARLRALDARLVELYGLEKPVPLHLKLREQLGQQRRDTAAELDRLTAEVSRRQLASLDVIQGVLPHDAALVAWLEVPRPRQVWGCVVRRDGPPAWVALRDSANVGDRLHEALTWPTGREAVGPLVDELRKQRVVPLLPHLAGVRRLFVVTGGAMARLPVELLAPEFLVSSVPSGSMLAHLLRQHRRLSADSLLALGDPAFTPTSVVTARGASSMDLPASGVEVNTLAGLVKNTTMLTRGNASARELDRMRSEKRLRDFRLLHFATHGEADEKDPDRSRLLLAQSGELTVQDIRRHWDLDADLVVLSACRTAIGKDAGGDGLLGFAHAFLARGARSVVLTRWKVDDGATALLMERFYQNLLGSRKGTEPLGRAAALEEAKRWLRDLPTGEADRRLATLFRSSEGPRKEATPPDKSKPTADAKRYAHPFYWAAFLLAGDPD